MLPLAWLSPRRNPMEISMQENAKIKDFCHFLIMCSRDSFNPARWHDLCVTQGHFIVMLNDYFHASLVTFWWRYSCVSASHGGLGHRQYETRHALIDAHWMMLWRVHARNAKIERIFVIFHDLVIMMGTWLTTFFKVALVSSWGTTRRTGMYRLTRQNQMRACNRGQTWNGYNPTTCYVEHAKTGGFPSCFDHTLSFVRNFVFQRVPRVVFGVKPNRPAPSEHWMMLVHHWSQLSLSKLFCVLCQDFGDRGTWGYSNAVSYTHLTLPTKA